MSERMTGAQSVVKTLEAAGIELVIGYIGHTDQEIADAMLDSKNIRSILCRTELTGAFIVDGYNRAKKGAKAIGIWHGPGTPLVIGGLAGAMTDSVPYPTIIGSVHSEHRNKGALQDTPVADLCEKFSKWTFRIDNGPRIPEAIQKAFKIATTGRPGPAVVEIPFDFCVNKYDFDIPKAETFFEPQGRIAGDCEQIEKAVDLLLSAERPALLAGGGVLISKAEKELITIAEHLQIPVVMSGMGKGAISPRHDLSVGASGLTGWRCANETLDEADVVVAIGFRFAEFGYAQQWSIKPEWKLVHIDIDPAEIGRSYAADIGIVGDAKLVLSRMAEYINTKNVQDKYANTTWFNRFHELKEAWLSEYDAMCNDDTKQVNPYRLVRILRETLPEDAIVTTDCGNNQCWGVHVFDTLKSGTFHMPGGYGHLGWSYPAALGLKLASPDKTVVAITGDGGFHYSFQELSTAVKENIPVIVIVFNDGWLLTNRQIQDFKYEGRYNWTELHNPDFVKLADSFGIEGAHVNSHDQIKPALEKAIASKKPYLLDVKIDSSVFFPATGFWTPRWDVE